MKKQNIRGAHRVERMKRDRGRIDHQMTREERIRHLAHLIVEGKIRFVDGELKIED